MIKRVQLFILLLLLHTYPLASVKELLKNPCIISSVKPNIPPEKGLSNEYVAQLTTGDHIVIGELTPTGRALLATEDKQRTHIGAYSRGETAIKYNAREAEQVYHLLHKHYMKQQRQ